MGKKDLDERIYLKNPAVFADACNFALFGGADVIQPESLREVDTSHVAARMNSETNEIFAPVDSQSESAVDHPVKRKKGRKGKSKAEKYIDTRRDIFQEATVMTDGKATYVPGIEAQSAPDRGMAIRVMDMDSASYSSQVKLRHDLNIAAGKIKSSSFLSGLLPEDRIVPVITLVFLFSNEGWNAPRSIGELFEDYDARIAPYIQDYKLNVIVPSEITNFDSFKTDLGLIMNFLKEMNDEDAVAKLLADKEAAFRNMDYDAARLLGNFADIKQNSLEDAVTEEGDVSMCKAWEDHGKNEAAKAVAKNNKEWQEKTADLEAKYADSEAKRTDMEAKLADSEAKRADMETKYTDLESKYANLTAEFLVLRDEIRQLRSQLA